MADEQAQEQVEAPTEEVEAPAEASEESQPSEETEASEKTEITQDESDKGDLRVPLKEEREKRQYLENLVRDPRFIAEQAARLGLTAKEEETAPARATGNVEEVVDFKLAMRDFPEVAKDPELLAYAGTLKDLYPGMSYHEAMSKAQDRFAKAKEAGQAEGKAKAKAEVDEKLKAQTVSNNQTAPTETDDLEERLHSTDKTVQEEALVELMMKRNKKLGIG